MSAVKVTLLRSHMVFGRKLYRGCYLEPYCYSIVLEAYSILSEGMGGTLFGFPRILCPHRLHHNVSILPHSSLQLRHFDFFVSSAISKASLVVSNSTACS